MQRGTARHTPFLHTQGPDGHTDWRMGETGAVWSIWGGWPSANGPAAAPKRGGKQRAAPETKQRQRRMASAAGVAAAGAREGAVGLDTALCHRRPPRRGARNPAAASMAANSTRYDCF